MSALFQMRHYVTRNPDGSVHVTNAVGGHIGQHHVHTEEGFAAWKRDGYSIEEVSAGTCDCGQRPQELNFCPHCDAGLPTACTC